MKLTNSPITKEEALIMSARVSVVDLCTIVRALAETYPGITKNGAVNAAMRYTAGTLHASGQCRHMSVGESLRYLRDIYMIDVKHITRASQTELMKNLSSAQPHVDGRNNLVDWLNMSSTDISVNKEHYMTLEDGTRRYNYMKDKFRQEHGNVGCEFLDGYNYCHEEKGLKQPVETHEESFMIAQTDQPPTPIQPSKPSEPSEQIQIPEFIDSDPRLEIDKVIASLATKPKPDK